MWGSAMVDNFSIARMLDELRNMGHDVLIIRTAETGLFRVLCGDRTSGDYTRMKSAIEDVHEQIAARGNDYANSSTNDLHPQGDWL